MSLMLGRAIVLRRTELNLSRPHLAVEAGISYPYLAEIETGRKLPPLPTLAKIASALDLQVSVLQARAEALDGATAPGVRNRAATPRKSRKNIYVVGVDTCRHAR